MTTEKSRRRPRRMRPPDPKELPNPLQSMAGFATKIAPNGLPFLWSSGAVKAEPPKHLQWLLITHSPLAHDSIVDGKPVVENLQHVSKRDQTQGRLHTKLQRSRNEGLEMGTESVRRSIRDFLDSMSSAKKSVVLCDCGCPMEYRDITFFYEGQNWEVSLPVCLKCHPIPAVSAHAA